MYIPIYLTGVYECISEIVKNLTRSEEKRNHYGTWKVTDIN